MLIRKSLAGFTAAVALAGGLALAAPAQAAAPGSLAQVLGVGNQSLGLDRVVNGDFDILREAAEAVLAAKPTSAVGVLADGKTPVTAFIPTDRAFQVFEWSLTGSWERSEAAVLNGIIAAAGTLGDPIDVIEQVLLYHVVPGAAVDSGTVLGLKGAPKADRTLTTANGGTITLNVWSNHPRWPVVTITDKDPNALNPFLVKSKLDIKAGSQIAHGIGLVLRPLDLPRG